MVQNKKLTEEFRATLISEYAKQLETAQNLAVDYEKQAYIIFTVGASLLSVGYTAINGLKSRVLALALLWILMAGAIMITAWVSTLFRRQALAEHNAVRLEKRLNELLGEDVCLWQSKYIDEYGIDRNGIGYPNKTLQITSWVFIGVLALICILTMAKLLFGAKSFSWINSPIVSVAFILCAVGYIAFSLRPLIKSLQNDSIRRGKSENLPK